MMHLLRKNDVAPLRSAMMRCLPPNVAKPRIIRRSRHHWALPNIICRRQTSFKKRTFVGRQKCVFCCVGVSISPKMIGCKINISQNGRRLLVKARKTASSPIIEFSFLNIVILLLVELQERRSKLSEKPIY